MLYSCIYVNMTFDRVDLQAYMLWSNHMQLWRDMYMYSQDYWSSLTLIEKALDLTSLSLFAFVD